MVCKHIWIAYCKNSRKCLKYVCTHNETLSIRCEVDFKPTQKWMRELLDKYNQWWQISIKKLEGITKFYLYKLIPLFYLSPYILTKSFSRILNLTANSKEYCHLPDLEKHLCQDYVVYYSVQELMNPVEGIRLQTCTKCAQTDISYKCRCHCDVVNKWLLYNTPISNIEQYHCWRFFEQ